MTSSQIRFKKALCVCWLLLALGMAMLAYVGILLVLGTMCIEFDTLWTTLQIPSNHRSASVSHVFQELAGTFRHMRVHFGMLFLAVCLACYSVWSFMKLRAVVPAIEKE